MIETILTNNLEQSQETTSQKLFLFLNDVFSYGLVEVDKITARWLSMKEG